MLFSIFIIFFKVNQSIQKVSNKSNSFKNKRVFKSVWQYFLKIQKMFLLLEIYVNQFLKLSLITLIDFYWIMLIDNDANILKDNTNLSLSCRNHTL